MLYEIIYLIAIIVAVVTGILSATIGQLLWYVFIDRLDEAGDRVLLWVADRVLGGHEIINKGDGQ